MGDGKGPKGPEGEMEEGVKEKFPEGVSAVGVKEEDDDFTLLIDESELLGKKAVSDGSKDTAAAEGERPDVVISDIKPPSLEELGRRLPGRRDGGDLRRLPVISVGGGFEPPSGVNPSPEDIVGAIRRALTGEQTAASETVVEDPDFPRNPLDIKVDEEITLRDKIKPLDDFWRTSRAAKSHAAAQTKLLEILPDLQRACFPVDSSNPPEPSDILNYKKLVGALNKAEPLYFYRTTSAKPRRKKEMTEYEFKWSKEKYWAEKIAMRRLGRGIEDCWRRERRVFLQMPPMGMLAGQVTELALKCPRMMDPGFNFQTLGLEYLDQLVQEYPQAAVLYQIIFSHLSQHILTRRSSRHREAYTLQQVSTNLAKRAGGWDRLSDEERKKAQFLARKFVRGDKFSAEETGIAKALAVKIDKIEGTVPVEPKETKALEILAPSLALLKSFRGTKEAKEFIDARLSLLLPTKGRAGVKESLLKEADGGLPVLTRVVQEDFITFDLIVFARAMGVYDEYKEIFEALAAYRQLQFFIDFHLDPAAPNKSRTVLSSLLDDIYEKTGKRPAVSSFGCGNALLEKILLGRGYVSRIDGVDKHKDGEDERIKEIGSKFRTVSVPVLPEGEDSLAFRERALEALPPADVVMAADSLHETSDPKYYLIKLFREKVKPGGYLYISDPIHCLAVDGHTKETQNLFDSTDYPKSMWSLEQCVEVLSYLTAIGAEVVAANVISGPNGYTDAFARFQLVLRKLPEDEIPYKIPAGGPDEEKGKFLAEDEQIFEVFPLNLIPPDQRQRVLDFIGSGFAQNFSRPIEFAEARAFVIARILEKPVGLGAQVRARVEGALYGERNQDSFRGRTSVKDYLEAQRCSPYPVEELLRIAMESNDELRTRNRIAGDVIALRDLLLARLQIDLTEAIRKVPGWKYFV